LATSKNELGKLIISLDFELFWGVRDKRSILGYGESLKNVKEVIPRLLDSFSKYGVNATFATVGLLFAKDKYEMKKFSPKRIPKYSDANLSPYKDGFSGVGDNGETDSHHFALDLIKMIKANGKHEISTHTFSHFYCLEEGQTKDDFEEDIKAAISIAEKEGINIESIVFPRNQFNSAYSDILVQNGIKSYRGNERVWFQRSQSEEEITLWKRIFRTANCYINLSGHHCYSIKALSDSDLPYDIPSSRFLRPYQSKLSFLKPFQLRRIKRSMSFAAKNGLVYHLWWHPHNFGAHMDKNFELLHEILEHYKMLNAKYGFKSVTMADMAKELESMI